MAPKQAADTHCLLTSFWWPHSVVILGWQQGFAGMPKGLGVRRGESRMGTSRCGLSVKLEASGAKCSAFSFDWGDDLSGNMRAQSKGAHLVLAQ